MSKVLYKFYDMETMTQEKLNGLALERNTLAKENERLNGALQTHEILLKSNVLEIERLNNIINELKYGIKELDYMFYETFRISQNGYYSISEWELKEFTNKLQELKGVDKE